VVASAAEAARFPHRICLLDLHNADPEAIPLGKVSAAAGHAAAEYIECAVEATRAGHAAAVVTAPTNKEALRLAGVPYPGHTEMLAALCGVDDVAMLLIHRTMRVTHVTTHVSVREACDLITTARVLTVLRLLDGALQKMRLPRRRIAVAGLNPHAGEGGLFGEEERREIAPAIVLARAEGIDAAGPLPPDTVFARQRGGEFEAAVAMLHDHGHIAIKTVGFTRGRGGRPQAAGVNVTLGLPIVRTSVDHGTAFDLVGQGVADPSSMAQAMLLAAEMGGGG
jgi:4-phospho-D-threonate 3-dehydrogenase / 4-phospho-D-erythronate 3-dehydrogenase